MCVNGTCFLHTHPLYSYVHTRTCMHLCPRDPAPWHAPVWCSRSSRPPSPRGHGQRAAERQVRHSPWSPLGYGHRRRAARASPGDGCHIVAREHARESGAQGRALEPAVPTLLQDTVCVALAQLQLVTLLGLVGVERQVPVGKRRVVSGAMHRRAPLHT